MFDQVIGVEGGAVGGLDAGLGGAERVQRAGDLLRGGEQPARAEAGRVEDRVVGEFVADPLADHRDHPVAVVERDDPVFAAEAVGDQPDHGRRDGDHRLAALGGVADDEAEGVLGHAGLQLRDGGWGAGSGQGGVALASTSSGVR